MIEPILTPQYMEAYQNKTNFYGFEILYAGVRTYDLLDFAITTRPRLFALDYFIDVMYIQ